PILPILVRDGCLFSKNSGQMRLIKKPIYLRVSVNSDYGGALLCCMFEIFKEAVMAAYLMKKNDRSLPYDELEKPSPGDLRNLFLLLMAGGLSPEDQDTFVHFFKYRGEYAELDTHIRRYDLDKFRPLR